MSHGPACPGCGKLVSFWRTQWRLGSAFACKRCGQMLEISRFKAMILGLSMLFTFWLLRPYMGGALGQGMLIIAIFVLGAPVTYYMTRPTRVLDAGPPDPASG